MSKKDTDALSLQEFNKFLNAIPRLPIYQGSNKSRAPLTPPQFQLLFKMMYYCALGITEVMKLTKKDIDLKNRFITLPKTRSRKINQTTIPPILITELSSYLNTIKDDNLFPNQYRQTAWNYGKKAGRLAGLDVVRAGTLGSIDGVYTYLFRHSYGFQMLRDGAPKHLVDLKMRARSPHNYGGHTLDDLKDWEKTHSKQQFLLEEEIQENVDWYNNKRPLYLQLASTVNEIIKKLLDSKSIDYHYVDFRGKEIESFEKKIRSGVNYSPKEMQDLAGIRVICYVKSDVDKVCEIIEQNFEIDKNRSQDKSKILGENKMGYLSIHYIAKLSKARTDLDENKQFKDLYFEIQVRTIVQHAWAEIEHDDVYKSSKISPNENIRRQFNLVSSVLEIADNEFQRLHEVS